MHQTSLSGMCLAEVTAARVAESDVGERGAVFTRHEVVNFILDLVGYTHDKTLYEQRLLEPSFGNGDFLLAAVERLVEAWHGREVPVSKLTNAIRAVELHQATFQKTRDQLNNLLARKGLTSQIRSNLLDAWLIQGDFLMEELPDDFQYVIGNPPYIRHEAIPDALMAEYRKRFHTIYDRADIYVPFIEKSLSLLNQGGVLGFICSDRWMKNRYGSRLRELVAGNCRLKFYVDMVDTPAFRSDVTAYPAITVISKGLSGLTRVARQPKIDTISLAALAERMLSDGPLDGENVEEVADIATGAEPWVLDSFDRLAIVRRLEREFPTLEEAHCKVGIGVATGADKFYVAPFDELDVEADRKLPLVTTRDIRSGKVQWRGNGVINPFNDEGGLVPLDRYPKLSAYLAGCGDALRKRHVSRKNPNSWYRTIDRIYPALARRPKLLIPDIKGEANIVYEDGKYYPHHNLYYITSDEWDLRILQAVLMSGIARLFVGIYSTKMRGGYLRFQAQYLRRIRIPFWRDVPESLRRRLAIAVENGDTAGSKQAVFDLYGIDETEWFAFGGSSR